MASLEDAITNLKSELASGQVEHASMADGLGAKFAAAEEERLQLRVEVEVILNDAYMEISLTHSAGTWHTACAWVWVHHGS